MNRHERDALLQFLEPLLRTRATEKDFAAETLILAQCARQPDALYLLVQRAMALQSALEAAQARLAQVAGTVESDAGSGDAEDPGNPPRPVAADRDGAWGRGLLAQAGAIGTGVGLGVAAGIVAGGLLLDGLQEDFMDEV